MKRIEANEFLSWAEAHGIGIDPEYAHNWPRNLAFLTGNRIGRYWECCSGDVRSQLVIMLEALRPWSSMYLWPKSPEWLTEILNDDRTTHGTLLAPVLPDDGFEGAYRFGSEERDDLIRVLSCAIDSSFSWSEDLFVVPDSGRAIVMTDHHGVIHVDFAAQNQCDAYVAALAEHRIYLPTEAPDPTFKPVDWMEPPDSAE